jgi:hypothetical protein
MVTMVPSIGCSNTLGSTDINFTRVTMVKITIIVWPASMFGAVKSVSSEILVSGRILMEFVVTGLCKKVCHVYMSFALG